nr:uncharacterized protein LOC121831769 isoform X2 [Peromyscus maniculatus bairdii]
MLPTWMIVDYTSETPIFAGPRHGRLEARAKSGPMSKLHQLSLRDIASVTVLSFEGHPGGLALDSFSIFKPDNYRLSAASSILPGPLPLTSVTFKAPKNHQDGEPPIPSDRLGQAPHFKVPAGFLLYPFRLTLEGRRKRSRGGDQYDHTAPRQERADLHVDPRGRFRYLWSFQTARR